MLQSEYLHGQQMTGKLKAPSDSTLREGCFSLPQKSTNICTKGIDKYKHLYYNQTNRSKHLHFQGGK